MSEAIEAATSAVEASPEEVIETAVEEAVEGLGEEVAEEGVESVEELQEEIQDAVDAGATEEEVKDMIREFEIKVNGKTSKRKIDLSDESAVQREMQMAAAGQVAMQEVAELKKTLETELAALRADPKSALKKHGLDTEELLETWVQDKISEMEKSPEQRAQEELQMQLEEARAEAKKLSEEKTAAEEKQAFEQQMAELNNEISDALDAYQSLPKTRKSFNKVAEVMHYAMEKGYDIDAKTAAEIAHKEIIEELQEHIGSLGLDGVKKLLGDEMLSKMREERKKMAQKGTAEAKKVEAKERKAAPTKKEKVKAKDFFKNL